VLVGDDDESGRNVARQTLNRFGCRVPLAANGVAAVARCVPDRAEVRVGLTGTATPVADGNAALVVLQAMNPTPQFMALSALGSEGGRARLTSAGGQYFLAKPYQAEALLRIPALILAQPALSPQFSAPRE
jgi:CheY-like chemotaxis protein